MTQAKTLFAAVALFVLLSAFAAAQEITAQDRKEMKMIESKLGAEIRFAQLESAISKNIIAGEAIIEKILEDNPEADVSELQSILDEMQMLLDEIQEVNFDAEPKALAEQFIVIKTEARELTKEFKTLTGYRFSVQEKLELQEKIQNKIKESNKGEETQIKNMIKEFNANKVQNMLNMFGTDIPGLARKVMNGETKIAEAKNQLKNAFKGLNEGMKEAAMNKIGEQTARQNVFQQSAMAQTMANLALKLQERAGIMQQDGNGGNQMNQGTGGNNGGSDSGSGSDGGSNGGSNGGTSGGSGSGSDSGNTGSGSDSGTGSANGGTSGGSDSGSGSGGDNGGTSGGSDGGSNGGSNGGTSGGSGGGNGGGNGGGK